MNEIIRKFQYNGEDSLLLPARREAFVTLQGWLVAIAVELGLTVKIQKQLLIAADEIFTNIASYGYPSGQGTAKVEVSVDMNLAVLTMIFTDSGVAYNPLETAEPDLNKPLAERDLGGLGVFMVKKIMDNVEYRREQGNNILLMTKQLPKA